MRVALLFTDIESSTQLFQKHPHAYPRAVTGHHELLAAAINAHGGQVFETIGDAVFAAFPRSIDAVLASVDAQRGLYARRWEDVGEIRVRMGVHTGDAELREGRYFGPAVQRCEKMMSTGYGGQILVSGATAAELAVELADFRIGLRDMGVHRLRGLATAESIFQLTHRDLRDPFPPLKSLTTFLSKLPPRSGSLVGRQAERAAIPMLLGSSRLVTVTGPKGIGKTRIAIEIGAETLDGYSDGVWFVDVGSAGERGHAVAEEVARAVGVDVERVRHEPAALFDALGGKQLLLIVDGCDRALDECAVLIENILQHSRHVRILATSRELIAITGESACRLGPLSDIESLALFRERAPGGDVVIAESEAPLVSQLISQLGGSPAAIEDAACVLATMPLEDVIARAADRRWSDVGFALLGPSEQTLLQRLCVLDGAWTLETAEAVASGGALQSSDILDLLSSLVEKSVIVSQLADDGSILYHVPELLRQYGRQRLADNGELEDVRLRSRHVQAITGEATA